MGKAGSVLKPGGERGEGRWQREGGRKGERERM